MKITVKIQSDGQTVGIQSIRLEHLNFNNLEKSDLDRIMFDITECAKAVIKKLAEGIK